MTAIPSVHSAQVHYWRFKPNHIAAMVIGCIVNFVNPLGWLLSGGVIPILGLVLAGMAFGTIAISAAMKNDQTGHNAVIGWGLWSFAVFWPTIIVAIILAFIPSSTRR